MTTMMGDLDPQEDAGARDSRVDPAVRVALAGGNDPADVDESLGAALAP